MSFTIAIRGIPNFAHLQYSEVESFNEIFSLFTIKAREGRPNDRVEIYTKENERVMLYIYPSQHSREIIEQFCKDPSYKNSGAWHHIRPSVDNPAMLGGSGTGEARDGEWQGLCPKVWPTWEQVKAQLERDKKERTRLQLLENEREEEQERAINEALDGALARVGHAAVMLALESLK